MSNSLWPHGLQHGRPLCPSPSPEVCPSSCPLHQWCHPAISSSDVLFSFCRQSFPAPQTFPMSQIFASYDQNTRVSASSSVLQTSIQGWFPLRLTGLISLPSRITALSWQRRSHKSMRLLTHAMQGHPRQTSQSREFWQNVIHWRREWQTTLAYLLWEPHELYKRTKSIYWLYVNSNNEIEF